MIEAPKEVWPEVENPRACLEGMFLHPPQPAAEVNSAYQRLAVAKLKHEQDVILALNAAIDLVKIVHDNSTCVKSGMAGCFPNCMNEPHRSAWVHANAALLQEQESRAKVTEVLGG